MKQKKLYYMPQKKNLLPNVEYDLKPGSSRFLGRKKSGRIQARDPA